MSSFIRWLVRLTVLLRDINAIRRGRIGARIHNKIVGRTVGRVTRKLFR